MSLTREQAATKQTASEGAPLVPRSPHDRRTRRRFVVRDNRSGFDRRRRYPVTRALRDAPRLLFLVLAAVNLLSALDFVYTLVALDAGIATEGNPVMAHLLEHGPALAWLFKTVMVLGVSAVIWHERRRRSAILVALGALVLYAGVVGYHVYGAGQALAR